MNRISMKSVFITHMDIKVLQYTLDLLITNKDNLHSGEGFVECNIESLRLIIEDFKGELNEFRTEAQAEYRNL